MRKAERAARRRALIPTWRGIRDGTVGMVGYALLAVLVLAFIWLASEVGDAVLGDGSPSCNVAYSDCG